MDEMKTRTKIIIVVASTIIIGFSIFLIAKSKKKGNKGRSKSKVPSASDYITFGT